MSDPYPPQPQQPNQPNQPYSGQPYYAAQPNPYAPQPYGVQPHPGDGPQFPPGYLPQPPVKKRRTGLIVGIVIAVFALLCCSGVVVAALKVGADNKTQSSRPGSATTDPDKPVTLKAPDTIGSLKKSTNAAQAQMLNSRLVSIGLENPFAAIYLDTNTPARRIVVWGGTGSIFSMGGSQTQLDTFFAGMSSQLGDAKPIAVDPGPTGGVAECAKSSGTGLKLTVCAWGSTNVLLGFIFSGLEPDAAAAKMRDILAAVVTKG